MSVPLTIDPAIASRVRLATATLEGVRVEAENPGLIAQIEAFCRDFAKRHAGATSSEIPGADVARALYKAFGIDPTKTRPSSEALVRRILKGDAFPRINSLVDALNLCSVKHQLSFGLYDLARIAPPVVLRLGSAGETYEGIRKASVNVEGRPVLVDAEGPFGNPTSDSGRTATSLATTNAWVVVYAPSSLSASAVEAVATDTAAFMTRHCGGRVSEVLAVL
jgi:DNA/RNA-binding domain of Phe-tRNA-synthetase-like protein